jgi:transposase
MKRLMTKILNLPGVIVEESLETEETIILSVLVKNKTAVCPRCRQAAVYIKIKHALLEIYQSIG